MIQLLGDGDGDPAHQGEGWVEEGARGKLPYISRCSAQPTDDDKRAWHMPDGLPLALGLGLGLTGLWLGLGLGLAGLWLRLALGLAGLWLRLGLGLVGLGLALGLGLTGLWLALGLGLTGLWLGLGLGLAGLWLRLGLGLTGLRLGLGLGLVGLGLALGLGLAGLWLGLGLGLASVALQTKKERRQEALMHCLQHPSQAGAHRHCCTWPPASTHLECIPRDTGAYAKENESREGRNGPEHLPTRRKWVGYLGREHTKNVFWNFTRPHPRKRNFGPCRKSGEIEVWLQNLRVIFFS